MILTGDYSAPEPITCPWCENPDDCKPGKPGDSPHHDLCCLDGPRRSCWPSAPTPTVQRHVPDRDLDDEASNAFEKRIGL